MKKPNDTMQSILDVHASMGGLPIEQLNHLHARQQPLLDRAAVGYYGTHLLKKAIAPMPTPVGKVENRKIPGVEGEQLIRIYTPKGDAPQGGWPVVVYFHGGGWVIATLDTYDASARALCNAADCLVVAADYRQAPENQFPAAHEDALNAYLWVTQNARTLKGNPDKIAIAGESAGGNMAAITTIAARDKGMPLPVHQLLVYPVTDMANGPNNASAKENANAKPLNTPMLHWFYDQYVPSKALRSDALVSPIYAELRGLPSATVILAQIDPLRSEGEAYAAKLQSSGVPTNLKIYEGVTHEFFGLAGLLHEATEAVGLAGKDLRNAFAGEMRLAA